MPLQALQLGLILRLYSIVAADAEWGGRVDPTATTTIATSLED